MKFAPVPETLPTRWRVVVALLAAAAVTFLGLLACERIGRLAFDLQYDDVSYAIDAADRIDAWADGGAVAALRSFLYAPPHSPASTLQAMAALALFADADFALYASNVLWVLAIALLVVAVTRRATDGAFGIGLAFALLSPPAFAAINEFRPDVALGLATTAMAWTFASAGLDARPARARWAGVLLGACLLVKPTFAPHTLALAAMLAFAAFAGSWRRAPQALRPFALPGREIAAFLAIGLALAAPYYAVAGQDIFHYFWSNAVGANSGLWNLPADLSLAALLEEFGPFLWTLPHYHLPVAAVVAVASLALLVRRRDRREASRVAALLAVGLVSGAIIVAGHHPSPFFFASMDWLAIFAAISGMSALAARLRTRARRILCAILALGLVPLLAANAALFGMPWNGDARRATSWNVRLAAAIRTDLERTAPEKDDPVAMVFVAGSGRVNATTLRWTGRRDGVTLVTPEMVTVSNLPWLQALVRGSDYVVFPQGQAAEPDVRLPIAQMHDALLAAVEGDPAFELLDGGPDTSYVLFANREMLRRFTRQTIPGVDGGVIRGDGLGGTPWEDARPMDALSSETCFLVPPGRPLHVSIGYDASFDGRVSLAVPHGQGAEAAVRAGSPGELHGFFTPTTYWDNCVKLVVQPASRATSPFLSITRFEVRNGR